MKLMARAIPGRRIRQFGRRIAVNHVIEVKVLEEIEHVCFSCGDWVDRVLEEERAVDSGNSVGESRFGCVPGLPADGRAGESNPSSL